MKHEISFGDCTTALFTYDDYMNDSAFYTLFSAEECEKAIELAGKPLPPVICVDGADWNRELSLLFLLQKSSPFSGELFLRLIGKFETVFAVLFLLVKRGVNFFIERVEVIAVFRRHSDSHTYRDGEIRVLRRNIKPADTLCL